MNERKLSELQKEYRAFFLGKMELYGINSPTQLTKEKKSKFFTEIKLDWAKHKFEKQQLKESKKKSLTIVEEPVEVYNETASISKEDIQTNGLNTNIKQNSQAITVNFQVTKKQRGLRKKA